MKNKMFLLAMLACTTNLATAKDFWQCVQANGKTVFSDLPCPKGQEQLTYITEQGSFVQGFEKNKELVRQQPKSVHSPPTASAPSLNHKMKSLECNNAKRAWKFEGDKLPSKDFNRTRIIADVIRNCGGWPVDLDI